MGLGITNSNHPIHINVKIFYIEIFLYIFIFTMDLVVDGCKLVDPKNI